MLLRDAKSGQKGRCGCEWMLARSLDDWWISGRWAGEHMESMRVAGSLQSKRRGENMFYYMQGTKYCEQLDLGNAQIISRHKTS